MAELRDRLVAAFAPRRVILFGSRATGTARADSDYDILVVAASDLYLEDRIFKAHRAVRDVPVSKDILVLTPDEFAASADLRGGIVREALLHGEVIYEAA